MYVGYNLPKRESLQDEQLYKFQASGRRSDKICTVAHNMLALTIDYFMSPLWRPEFHGDSTVGKFCASLVQCVWSSVLSEHT
jgi:hypothetical protein